MAEVMFTSLASEVSLTGRDGLAVGIRRVGGEYLVIRSRDGNTASDNWPNRFQAWMRARMLGCNPSQIRVAA